MSMTLIVAEKESVAEEIAKVTGSTQKSKGYFSGNGYLVTWCIGHLVDLADPDAYGITGKWTVDQLPIIPQNYYYTVLPSKQKQFEVVKSLMERDDVTDLIEATDAGREGELIFRLVYQQAGCTKPFKRFWTSSLEESSIRAALRDAKPSSDYDTLYASALARQQADWLCGINFTRFYSAEYHTKLRCGRVKTPTLAMVVQREREIKHFVPQPYFIVTADLGAFKATLRVDTEDEAEKIIAACRNADATVLSVKKEEKSVKPQALYDLTTLQREASRLLGYSAKQTLDYLQSLYDHKLATYPRTDSRFLTEDMAESTHALVEHLLASGIIPALLTDRYQLDAINIAQVIDNAKVSDHHAVLPTANVSADAIRELPTGEKNILLMVMYRLLTAIYTPYVYAATKIQVDIGRYAFTATSNIAVNPGYRIIDGILRAELHAKAEADAEDQDETASPSALPDDLAEGAQLSVQDASVQKKMTKPPKSYDDDTLLDAMEHAGKDLEDEALRATMKENHGLGTTATRAAIIESLVTGGYLERKGKKYIPTDIAYTFIDLCDQRIKDPVMTAEWESQLEYIRQGALTANAFLQEINKFVVDLIAEQKAALAGKDTTGIFRRERPVIGTCPKCGKAVREYPKSWSCESGKDGCGFTIWKTIASKNLSAAQAEKLLTDGKTGVIKGFKSKTGKSFSARLVLHDDFTVGFLFDEKK